MTHLEAKWIETSLLCDFNSCRFPLSILRGEPASTAPYSALATKRLEGMGKTLMRPICGTHLRIDGQIQDRRYSPNTHLRQDSSVPETRILRHEVNVHHKSKYLFSLSQSACV